MSHDIGAILCRGSVAMNHFVLARRLKAQGGHTPVRGLEAIETDRIGMLRS